MQHRITISQQEHKRKYLKPPWNCDDIESPPVLDAEPSHHIEKTKRCDDSTGMQHQTKIFIQNTRAIPEEALKHQIAPLLHAFPFRHLE
jgi:hypothetical protein